MSGTECLLTQSSCCVVPVRESVFFDTSSILCSVGQGLDVFLDAIYASLLVTRGALAPQFPFGHLSLLSEWCGGLRLAVRGGWRLAISFENSSAGVTSARSYRKFKDCFSQKVKTNLNREYIFIIKIHQDGPQF